VRVGYYLKYRKLEFLLAPFYRKPEQQVVYETRMDFMRDGNGDILYYKYKPGTYSHNSTYDNTEHTVNYYINKYGFRNDDFGKKEDGRYRIIVLGGSSVAGLESPDAQTFPAYLEQFLIERNGNIEVISMGVGSYDAYEVYNLLDMEAYRYEPDLILLYIGRNDVHHNTGKLVLDTPYKKALFFIHNKLKYKVMSYTYLIEKISVLKQGHADPYLFYPYDPYPEFLENFKKILNFAKERQMRAAVVCQVANFDGQPQRCIEIIKRIQEGDIQRKDKSDLKESFIIKLFGLQKIIKDIVKEYENVQFIDPRFEFYERMKSSRNDYFVSNNADEIHLTPLGNRVLAEIVSRKLNL
jgi:lysophospholipase L1-like esterase